MCHLVVLHDDAQIFPSGWSQIWFYHLRVCDGMRIDVRMDRVFFGWRSPGQPWCGRQDSFVFREYKYYVQEHSQVRNTITPPSVGRRTITIGKSTSTIGLD